MACTQTMIPDEDGYEFYGSGDSSEQLNYGHHGSTAGLSTIAPSTTSATANNSRTFRVIRTTIVKGEAHPQHTSERIGGRKHLIARPRALQFFHHKVLHRQTDAENEDVARQAGRFELFFDLLYVCLCANFAEDLIHHPDGVHVVKYVFSFVCMWQCWSYITFLMNSYYNDDLLQRIFILWMMALMVFFGNNAASVDTSLTALRGCVASYMLARASFGIIYLVYSVHIGQHTVQLRALGIVEFLHATLWIPCLSASVSLRNKAFVALVALLMEQFTWAFIHSALFRSFFRLSFSTAVDIEHHIDRLAAFFIIVLGEFLYGLVFGSPMGGEGVSGKVGRAVMVLVIAWCLCWLYTASDGAKNNPEAGTHAIRYKIWTAYLWFFVHLPLTASLVIAGDTLTVFVKEGDVKTFALEKRAQAAAEVEASSVEGEGGERGDIMAKLRWLFCGCYALGLICLWCISSLHHEHSVDEATNTRFLVFGKWVRRFPRLISGIIIACLPLAGMDELPTTALLGTVTALTASCVLWEMYGALDPDWKFVEPTERVGRECCQGRCRAMMDAEGVNCLDSLLKCKKERREAKKDAEKGIKVTAKGGNQNILGDAE